MAVMKYWSSVHCGHCVTAVFPTSLLPQPSQMTQLSSAGPATAMLSKVSPAGGKRRCPLRSSSTPSRSAQMKWFNKLLNGRQKAAVVRVMEGQCRPMPYVIFGPPGSTHCTAFVTWLIYIASLCDALFVMSCLDYCNSLLYSAQWRFWESSAQWLVDVNAL